MPTIIIVAIISMFSALGLYSIGVWSERLAGRLKLWHLLFFWGGLIFDTLGTTIMGKIAGGFDLDFHGITGALAIFLMFGHAIWASVALYLKQEKVIQNFHKFSLAVWVAWLIPFVSGLIIANMK